MSLTKFEVSRLVGLRALELGEGAAPQVHVANARLREDPTYVAALELFEGCMRARVRRGDADVDVTTLERPLCLAILLDTMDGETRSYRRG